MHHVISNNLYLISLIWDSFFLLISILPFYLHLDLQKDLLIQQFLSFLYNLVIEMVLSIFLFYFRDIFSFKTNVQVQLLNYVHFSIKLKTQDLEMLYPKTLQDLVFLLFISIQLLLTILIIFFIFLIIWFLFFFPIINNFKLFNLVHLFIIVFIIVIIITTVQLLIILLILFLSLFHSHKPSHKSSSSIFLYVD